MIASRVRSALHDHVDGLDARLGAVAAYALLVALVAWALPMTNEVPRDFPATLLWKFRVVSLGTQLVLWTVLSLVFGALADRLFRPRGTTARP